MVAPAPLQKFLACVERFSDANLPFMVVGSFAVMAHGSPRTTKDIDIVLRLPFEERERVRPIVEAVATGAAEERTDPQWGKRLTAPVHPGLDLEVFFTPAHPGYQQEYDRRVVVEIEGQAVPFLSPEDLILRKLVNSKIRAGQDIADAINVAKIQATALDVSYLRENCAVHRVCGRLEEVLREAGVEA